MHTVMGTAAGHRVQPAVAVVLVPTGELEISPSMTPERPFQEQNFQHNTRKAGGERREEGIENNQRFQSEDF